MDSRYLSPATNEGHNISRRLSIKSRNGGPMLRQLNMDKILDDISIHFKDLLQPDANTLETALALMDSSSIGKARYREEFESLKEELQTSLKTYVDANYQGFNSSIGSYRTIVQCISNSEDNIDSTQQLIVKAKSDLATRRPLLKELRSNSLKYEHMIEILNSIEQLKSVPDRLELEIAQKQFLSAHNSLSSALRTIENEDLSVVGGLQPLQNYLSSQESSLFSILIEELCNHLYLKSPYCDTRWSVYSQGKDEVSGIEQLLEDKVKFDMSEESLSFSGSALLDDFLSNFDKSTELSIDNHISEENSFNYIRLVVETLGKLNKLPSAFDLLQQRLPLELSKVIDKTVAEVRHSAPKDILLNVGEEDRTERVVDQLGDTGASLNESPDNTNASSKSHLFSDFEDPNNDARLSVLKDLVWTLYSKFIAILQGHRVVYEVVTAISNRLVGTNREGLLSYDYYAVVTAIQGEIISLMKSYINSKKVITPTIAATTLSKFQLKRQQSITTKSSIKNKIILKFSASDPNNKEVQIQTQLLKNKLETTVPGLVLDEKEYNVSSYAPTDLSTRHSLLISPNVLNIRALLEPAVVFLQRAKVIHPYADRAHQQSMTSSTLLLLDDFLNKSYLPRLEESLKSSFQQIMSDSQSFQVDPHWTKLSKRPIFQGATSFIKLIRMACKLLNTGYMYREKYAILLISTIGWLNNLYLQKYNEFIEKHPDEITSNNANNKKSSAILAIDPTARSLAKKIMHSTPHTPDSEDSISREIDLFLAKRYSHEQNNRVKQNDLLDVDSYTFLSILTTSLRWITLELEKMRKVKEVDIDHTDNHDSSTGNLRTRMKKRWTLIEANHASHSYSDDSEYLTLSGKSIEEFDKSLSNLINLAETSVFTLRFDLRLRCVYYIDRSMLEGNYHLDTNLEERDSFIGLLDKDIVNCDEAVGETLVKKDRDCIIRGLAKVLNELLIYSADSLRLINSNGLTKMYSNILVLQQMLKSVAVNPKDVDFNRALEFYDHIKYSVAIFMQKIKNNDTPINYEEAKILCRLLHQDQIHKYEQQNNRDLITHEKRQLNDHLRLIHEHFWSSEKITNK